jgi:hypothetical protein
LGTITRAGDHLPFQRVARQPLGSYAFHQASDIPRVIRFDLVDFVVPVISVAAGIGVGGIAIHQHDPGFIHHLAARAKLSVRVPAAKQADFTNGAVTINLGLGSVTPQDADALGVDATDVDFAAATAYALTAFQSNSIAMATAAAAAFDGTTNAIKVNLNCGVAAADIVDDKTTEVWVTGAIWLAFFNAGGVP